MIKYKNLANQIILHRHSYVFSYLLYFLQDLTLLKSLVISRMIRDTFVATLVASRWARLNPLDDTMSA